MFQVGGVVFWVLVFVIVWQQQGQVIDVVLFGFVGSDELVDYDLGVVGEVVELVFLDVQCVWIGGGEVVFIGYYCFFVEQ